ncbi:16882_t:CDS:2 [Cetraspora pellucida]|uniref:16882_t:CDS:1 n=1 Tax=Cetraspora pellucida TaxID=1433469 RepID=A0A9N9GMH8_9GLOM|nr:16882_t:CDS:2 [Cetraspora pellucida]
MESLREPRKDDWEKGSGDTFDEFTYKEEELDEIDGYYTVESLDDELDLYDNLWKDEVSPAIYLTLVEKVPDMKKEETELTLTEWLEKFAQADILSKEEKENAHAFFREESCLLTIGIDKLGTTSLVTHHVDTGEARPIKQYFYRMFPDKQEFLDKELESLERQGLIANNNVKIDSSAQKCREWLLSSAECDAKECEGKTELGGYTGWSIKNMGITARDDNEGWDDSKWINEETETWWDFNKEFEVYTVIREESDEKEGKIKLEEGVELRHNLPVHVASRMENGCRINDNSIKFQKLSLGYCMALQFTHLTRSYGKIYHVYSHPTEFDYYALEVLNRCKTIHIAQHCGYRLIAHDLRKLSVLWDWIVSGARQELA